MKENHPDKYIVIPAQSKPTCVKTTTLIVWFTVGMIVVALNHSENFDISNSFLCFDELDSFYDKCNWNAARNYSYFKRF